MSKTSVLKNTAIVGGFTLLSRVLGLVREMLQSRLIGAGVEQSAFVLAFAIPNMTRKLFGEGALTAAFVPVFKGEVERERREKGLDPAGESGREVDVEGAAARLARAVLTMVMLLLGSVVAATMAILALFACFADLSPRAALTVRLVLILLPYMLAICGAAFGMGVLNAVGRFKASSVMPSLLNVIWIATLAVLALMPGVSVPMRVLIVSAAILAGGFAQMAYMFHCMARVGVRPVPLFGGWRMDSVRRVWRNLGVAAMGAGAVQINYALDQVLAQLAAPWAAGVIGYAERLMDLPLGVIGVAFGTVLLPTLSGSFARCDVAEARATLASSVRSMLFLMIPASVGLAVLAVPVTCVIYQGGSFDAVATLRVARALAVYALGLAFFGMQKTLIPWFQAQNDMTTPLRVSVMTVVLNATLNILAVLLLPVAWRHVGLAASTVVCAAVGMILLFAYARRKNGSLGLSVVVRPTVRIALAAAVMGVVLLGLRGYVASLSALVQLGALVVAGVVVYASLIVLLMGREGLRTFRMPSRRRRI